MIIIIINGSPNLSQKTRPYDNQQKKEDGTWRWKLYQSGLVLLVLSPKDY